ncbi:hypothetical protein LOC67_18920 [Stieleria sp. JC731]|uniref:hypothetical protein n=1 Tax=Pirellulaceae TaxID=2691357 RepID=UPI001E41FDEE|nr:hypothetical protein [Stieleria sp. JC731]MCC9602627.1 hypothetical protein [Stieleria sp. JC731]
MDAMDGGERMSFGARSRLPQSTAGDQVRSQPVDSARVVKAIGLTLVLVILALLVPIPFHGRAASAIGDLVHAPLFGTLTLAWLYSWQRLRPLALSGIDREFRKLLFRCLIAGSTLVGFGIAMEFAQSEFGRSMSRHDAIANTLGVAAAIAIYLGRAVRRMLKSALEISCYLTAFAFFMMAWVAPVRMLSDVAAMHLNFPRLSSFESDTELTRWYCNGSKLRRSSRYVTEGTYGGEIIFLPGDFPAITQIAFHHDWRGKFDFQVDAMLPDDSPVSNATLVLKFIDHQSHNGEFEKIVQLTRGTRQQITVTQQEFEAMAEHGLDLSHIQFIDIGMVKPTVATVVAIDHLRLVPR